MRISADKINWTLAFGEMALIVIGILMALAIDSYADRRADEAQAAVYLNDLVTELQSDKLFFEKRSEGLGKLIDAATQLLQQVEGEGQITDDPVALLLGAIAGETVTREPVIWVEMQVTGTLRLIPNSKTRTAIVGYYLDRASWAKVIDENFVPAVRELRALAWDVLPVEVFPRYFQTLQSGAEFSSGVSRTSVMTGFQSRADTIYLLKRVIVTGTVARSNLKRGADKTTALIAHITGDSPLLNH
ncbi:MAG: hypothetical protein HKN50_12360 [Gammaproteobacteria bacterium]|nr:hypothetical protein [Gammaproteobacteria bacterium]